MVAMDVEVVVIPTVNYEEQIGIMCLHVPTSILMPLMHLLHTQIQLKTVAKNPKWMLVMQVEMDTLKQNPTWTLAACPMGSNQGCSKHILGLG